jgi:hypothetical protein
MAIYPTFKLYIDEDGDGNPTDNQSVYAVSDLVGQYGIFTDKDTDRLASTGSISFTVDNRNLYYSDNVNFAVGTAISITATALGFERQVFSGRISTIKIDTGSFGDKQVRVTAVDWMDLANKVKVKNLPVYSDLSADEAFPYLLALMAKQPEQTDYDEGTETFGNVFDGALPRTAVYSELDKLTKSELGYLYLKHKTDDYGVTLRFENRLNRGSTRELDTLPVNRATPSFLKYHGASSTTGYLKYHGESSTSGKIQISEVGDAEFDNLHFDAELTRGDNIINKFTVINVPRNTDTTVQVLYTLGAPLQWGAGEKKSISATYSDANGGTIIRAFDVVTPVITTDYLFNSLEDGSGTNLSANLLVLFNYGANGFTFSLRNNGPAGYLTRFQVRGKGIYKYNPIEFITENEESIQLYGELEDTIRREYSENTNTSQYAANAITGLNRFGLKNLKRVDFLANSSEFLMSAFLFLDVGSKVRILEDFPAIDNTYYIQGIKFSLGVDGILQYSWYLKRASESILQPIAVRGNTDAHPSLKKNAIDFGILPHLANMQYFSYSAWVRLSGSSLPYMNIVSRTIDDGSGRRGSRLYVETGGSLTFWSYKTPTDGIWDIDPGIPTDNAWHHVVVTYDNTTATADPIVYVDGVSKTITEFSTPSGTSDSDSDCPVILFSTPRNPTLAEEYEEWNRHGSLKDVRIYSKILTQAEVTELASGEDDYTTVQDGLEFNGIFAPRDLIDDYIGDSILADDIVLETVTMAAGTPYNEDTSNTNYILQGEAL